VEWGYKDIKQYFNTLDFQRKLRIRETAVGKQYLYVVPQSGAVPQEEESNGRPGRSRDTRYGTRGPGSRADRNAKT